MNAPEIQVRPAPRGRPTRGSSFRPRLGGAKRGPLHHVPGFHYRDLPQAVRVAARSGPLGCRRTRIARGVFGARTRRSRHRDSPSARVRRGGGPFPEAHRTQRGASMRAHCVGGRVRRQRRHDRPTRPLNRLLSDVLHPSPAVPAGVVDFQSASACLRRVELPERLTALRLLRVNCCCCWLS